MLNESAAPLKLSAFSPLQLLVETLGSGGPTCLRTSSCQTDRATSSRSRVRRVCTADRCRQVRARSFYMRNTVAQHGRRSSRAVRESILPPVSTTSFSSTSSLGHSKAANAGWVGISSSPLELRALRTINCTPSQNDLPYTSTHPSPVSRRRNTDGV